MSDTKYKINGIHCPSCTKLIRMGLDEAGFDMVKVDVEKEQIEIPKDVEINFEKVKSAVEAAGEYNLVEV